MSVLRAVVSIVACVVFVAVATLLGSDSRSLSTREILLRESAALLPPDARIVTRDYRERCAELLALRSPPCLSVRFLAPGSANRLAGTMLDRAAARWNIARKQNHRDGWSIRLFRAGQHRARASIRTLESRNRCRSPLLGAESCADWLLVELGPPIVFRPLRAEFAPPSIVAELPDRRYERLTPKKP